MTHPPNPLIPNKFWLCSLFIIAVGLLWTRTARAQATENPASTGATPPPAAAAAAAAAATGPQSEEAAQLQELKRQLDALAAEVEQLRSGEQAGKEQTLSDERRRALGLAPSAAATYRKKQGVSFAGYGDLLFERFDRDLENGSPSPQPARIDFPRMVLYTGYRFSEKFLFNSELEIEHANEASVEFAYLDYMINDHVSIRGGMLLVPLGLANEFHEPTVLMGARRPETERRIIPSTWKENGAGILGSFGPVDFRVYVLAGLNAEGFSASGLRGGRQEGSESRIADAAIAGRLDYTLSPGIFIGGGLYHDGADQDQFGTGTSKLNVKTTIGEVHAQANVRGFDVRGLYARASVGEAARLNRELGLGATGSIAEVMDGGYLQLGYNVLSQRNSRLAVTPYYRFESVNTQASVSPGFRPDLSKDGTFHTIGLELRPIDQIVLKTDYQVIGNTARSGRNQFNISLGYAF